MEQQTAVTRTSLPDPFDDVHTNAEVKSFRPKKNNYSIYFSQASKDQIYYCPIPSDICMDLSRRLPHYLSDYYDSKICSCNLSNSY
jgi:hypothetical protein